MPQISGMPVSQPVADLNRELVDTAPGPGRSPAKWHNARAQFQSMTFDSGHEAGVVAQFVMLEEKRQGVFGLRLQVRFPLPGGIIYEADLTYLDEHLQGHVVDAKAWDVKTRKFVRTPEYKLKRRLFREQYGREIEEV